MRDIRAWELEQAIESITYKPGWTLSIRYGGPHEYGETWLVINAEVIDVHTGRPSLIGGRARIPMYLPSVNELYRWIMREVERVELHEVREWFKVDGRCLIEPHPELAPA